MTTVNLTYIRGTTLYINPSSQCTNNCLFCVRNFGDGVYGYDLRLHEYPKPEEISNAIKESWSEEFQEVAIVGFGEPLLNLDATLEAIRTVKSLSNVPVRINTNGHVLLTHPYRDVPAELAEAGLDRIQVSLNAHDASTYVRLCRPSFGENAYTSLLEFAKKCSELMDVELSVVELPGIDIKACRKIANDMGVGFLFRKFKGPPETLESIGMMLME